MPPQNNSTTQNESFIRDGDHIITDGLTLDNYSQFLQNAAIKYDGDNRHDRAAGLREAAAAFEKCYRTSNQKNTASTR